MVCGETLEGQCTVEPLNKRQPGEPFSQRHLLFRGDIILEHNREVTFICWVLIFSDVSYGEPYIFSCVGAMPAEPSRLRSARGKTT